MKVAAAQALAKLARQEVPEVVLKAYRLDRLGFGPDYLIPKPFDPRVLWTVAPAVAAAATAEGLALVPLADPPAYAEELRSRFQASHGLINTVTALARTKPQRVVYPHGDDVRILRSARRVLDEGIGSPVLLGDVGLIREMSSELGISLDGIETINPESELQTLDRYAEVLHGIRREKGLTLKMARSGVTDHNMFAALMVREGEADAVLGGLTTFYPDTIRPALQALSLESGRTIVSSVYVVILDGTPYFFTDCAVNIEPTSEQLVEIAEAAVDTAMVAFNRQPRVAFISYSDFGSAKGNEPERVRAAAEMFSKRRPDIPVDGEMQADTAVVDELIRARRPGGALTRAANVLVFPNLTAANASYKLLNRLANAEVIGPILSGLSKAVHVLQRDAEVSDVVNLTAIAVADAQRKAARAAAE
jgi:malate dehydrogenase (oxaloacetate-decarboxylating)(NADP+)